MNYRITLSHDHVADRFEVIADEASLRTDRVLLEGVDPYQFPAEVRDSVLFLSKELTAVIDHDRSATSVKKIEPTEESVPEVVVSF